MPWYDGTIDRGTTDGVMSQPNAPGVRVCDRSALNCSIHPRAEENGFSNTPKYTFPSGPMVGEAVPLFDSVARFAGVRASRRSARPVTASVDVFSATR